MFIETGAFNTKKLIPPVLMYILPHGKNDH
jgi:hypothetical protein